MEEVQAHPEGGVLAEHARELRRDALRQHGRDLGAEAVNLHVRDRPQAGEE
jgi:hypothetical protein